ncbi:amino acid adenylation domain-containing protein/non-ribosomal peptide synthase protein (TIGR01720 family) [Pseudomonas sp. W2I6]|nr:amino acid adenylation domain-containing protein/non-ribosomal peptide synthase protein (TIGR01720 family) [Pseudomonas sp. W2I6]
MAIVVDTLDAGTDPHAGIAAYVQTHAEALFDLQTGPLLRVKLLRLADDDHVLVLTQHHIVSDGWSMQLMVQELVELYDAFSSGRAPEARPLPIQYADYAAWQRQWMEAGERKRQLAYWTRQLAGDQPLQLPLDYSRPAEQSFRGAQLEIVLQPGLGASLLGLAQQLRVTPFMLLLASFQTLLHRYSGQSDIRVGVPIANRNRVETERLIGFFVNTQVLKADVKPTLAFADVVQQVRQTALEAQAHQDLPFEQLVEALHPERSLSHSPLFQVMFNHQSEAARGQQATRLPGLAIESLEWASHTAQFDLVLNTFETGQELAATLTYATDLFAPATVERLAGHWQNLLCSIVADHTRPVAELSLLGGHELELIERTWNANTLDFPRERCIHQQIQDQVQRTPDALAVIWNDEQLTYRQLNGRANALAHKLVALGVGPEVRVGVAMPRSAQMVVALLAVLKAGGAYVPLDPDYPAERVAYMLKDSQARVLLTQVAVALEVDASIDVLLVDAQEVDDQDLDVAVHAGNLAYVIYTSGSTGLPKGVAITHRNVAALTQWSQQVYSPEDIQGVLASTSICFDLSVWELFVTLAGGGFIVGARNALELPELAARDRVRLINSVPSAMGALQRAGQIPQSVRIINLAGEPLKQSLVDALYEHAHVQHVYDLYGPSEDTTYSTWTRREAGGQANIGRPLANTASYLLDAELHSVPVGVAAELYLAGEGITRGYLLRPGLTAEKFVPNPFSTTGDRLYRTGDLTRYRNDGVIEYVGRIDHQVKIRGLRIELGEIESRLLAHPGVREGVVLALDGANGQQLVAYVVLSQATTTQQALRASLREHLPDYMVPTQWLFLEQLPLTPNGKLDRKALPQPDLEPQHKLYIAPHNELEQRIVAIWQDVLKVPQIGVSDNFFELGGDSIISIQVVSRARQAGIRFTPKELFQHQTVQGLASVAQLGEGALLIDQGPVTGDSVLLPIHQAFFDTAIPERHHWNQSVLLKTTQPLNPEHLEQALHALLVQHDALRVSFVRQADGWRATYQPVSEQPLLWQRSIVDASALEQLGDEAQRSLDLGNGPLLRAVLATLADGSQRLLLVIHHLAVDGVSWRILFEDLQTAYEQLQQGRVVALPAKTSSVKAWAQRLQGYARTERLQQELHDWQTLLADVDSALPCLDPEAGLRNDQGATVHSALTPTHTRQLLQNAPKAYRTQVNDLLLTALARVVCRWTGHADALIQLEGHGREDLFDDIDLTRSIGWFTSVFPVKLTPAADPAQSLKGIKEQLRAIPDKGLGFGVLRYLGDAQAQAALKALPTPRITFNYLGQLDGHFEDDNGALFVPSGEARGAEHSPQAPLDNWLALNGQVFDGELRLSWTFSPAMFATATIQGLADDYACELASLVEHCCTSGAAAVTPSDFPLANLSQAQLDALPIPAQAIADIYPLAPMQQGMLFHTLYEQASGNYVNQMRLDVEGLDPQRFRQAWQAVLDHHDILRTCFVWQGELAQPVQVVLEQVELPFVSHDLSGHADLATALDALAADQQQQGFDLAQAPLLRLVLIRTGVDQYHFIYTHHHILMDGWSNSQLLGEVLQRYSGQFEAGRGGRYRDYIAWLDSQDRQANQRFWTLQLADLQEPTRLAQAQAQGEVPGSTGYSDHYQYFDAERTMQLSEFARRQKVTLNTLVQAAWALLLQRQSGQSSVCFGATVAGRPAQLAGVEQQVGLFINTLPVVVSPRPEQTIAQLLQALQAQNLALREHEYTPLFEIQRWAGQGGEALFDSLLVFENYPVSKALEQSSPDGLRFGRIDSHEQTNYPLTLMVNLGEALSLQYSFDQRFFAPGQIQALAAQLHNLLQAMTLNADRPLGTFDSLDDGERSRVLEQWNATDADFSALRVHSMIEQQALHQPDAVAAVFNEQTYTYRQLNEQANQLAHKLLELGVGPDQLVGICVERSLEMLVGLLAVLKAGAAYVPLDPDFPVDRLEYMIADSGIGLLLTQARLKDLLVLPAGLTTVDLDPRHSGLASYPQSNPHVSVKAASLAYVIYTSGSTGKPKGVMVGHAALSNFLASMAKAPGMSGSDRVLSLTTFSFDIFGLEIYLPLVLGARVVLVGKSAAQDPAQVLELVRREHISVVQATPSTWRMLLDNPEARALQGCKMLCGGEALAQDLADRMLALSDQVWNLYGPTETTIWSAQHPLSQALPQAWLGRPIDNTHLYILGSDLQPVPVGVVGELLIGGEGLARGYHQRAGLTAERFIPHPFSSSGQRLYRTGDLARYRADGVIEYVGRLDHQVKIRGFRIELGEIQARLQEHPAVREAAVIAREGGVGLQLVGYVVPGEPLGHDRQVLLRDELKARLMETLPAYMVPAFLVMLDSLPLTPNGKLDRKALPAPDASQLQQAYVAPHSDLQRQVAGIWQQVLQLEQVGLTDNFFELGGHSLLAVNVVSRIQLELGLKLTPQLLFQHPLLEDFAHHLEHAGGQQINESKLSKLEFLLDEMEEV